MNETAETETPTEMDSAGGGLTADDTAQPTTTSDTPGDRATGLEGMRGG